VFKCQEAPAAASNFGARESIKSNTNNATATSSPTRFVGRLMQLNPLRSHCNKYVVF